MYSDDFVIGGSSIPTTKRSPPYFCSFNIKVLGVSCCRCRLYILPLTVKSAEPLSKYTEDVSNSLLVLDAIRSGSQALGVIIVNSTYATTLKLNKLVSHYSIAVNVDSS